jgi:hypothetical protein
VQVLELEQRHFVRPVSFLSSGFWATFVTHGIERLRGRIRAALVVP